jgi:Na+-translocating ferredoxin:NAD+ oxidoreductase RnfD subunit
MNFSRDIKLQFILFLSAFALYWSLLNREPGVLIFFVLAAVFSALVDSLALWLKTKKLVLTPSSLISGLIIGFVLSSDLAVWKLFLACLIAVLSKHLIKFRQRHIFNPAACGVFLLTVVFGATTEWKGAYSWYILLPAGAYFIFRIRKIEIFLGYFIAALLIFAVQAVVQKTPPGYIFGYLNYFFMAVMLIEPKTTPVKKTGKWIFGIGAAALVFLLTEAGVRFDAELCCLLVANLAVPILNRFP